MDLPKPKSRKEKYLAAICGKDAEIPNGKTREEKYMQYIAENSNSNSSNTEAEYASKMIYGDDAVSLGRKEGTAVGTKSYAFGYDTTATGEGSHAEGYNTTASNMFSHAEGYETIASGYYAHAEGYGTKAGSGSSHAEGYATTATGESSHAEGYNTTAYAYAHSEGSGTKAGSDFSHAEGYNTTVTTFAIASHAEGRNTTATGESSHAEGCATTATGENSHAEGYYTTALKYQHATGCYNDETLAVANASAGTGEGTAFVIGNGTSSSKSNAFRVDYNGKVFAKSEYASTGADYAEYFEWLDGNENAEDRRGYFVTMNGDKIEKADSEDYILGIVSGQPAILGNNDECYMGRYELDEFGSYIEEEIIIDVEKTDEETGEVKTVQEIAKRWKEKDTYDTTLPYIPRAKRKEWSAIGMLGVLSVRDDGTCEVNGYCKCGKNGIATKADAGYRVIKRINENIVKVILK